MPLTLSIVPAASLFPRAQRVARGDHDLVATGPCAALLPLLPVLVWGGGAAPVQITYRLAVWLAMPLLVLQGDARALRVFHYIVGPERLGAALDAVLPLLPRGGGGGAALCND